MKKRLILTLITLVICIVSAIFVISQVKLEPQKKPILEEKITSRDANFLYSFYISHTPEITKTPYYGKEKAPVTIVAYMDMNAASTKKFFKETFPLIKEHYINPGKVKFYFKGYLTNQDIAEQNKLYNDTILLICIGQQSGEAYYDYVMGIGNKVLRDKLEDCKSAKNEEAVLLASETENFGLIGINPRFYIGVSGNNNVVLDGIRPFSQFNTTIRRQLMIVGD